MKYKKELKDMLYEELEKIGKKGELSAGSLDTVFKLTSSIKNIDKIEMLEEADGYSEDSRWMADGKMYGSSYDSGNSYARGRRNAKRDSMGRYSRDGGNYSNDIYSMDGRYSMDGSKDYLIEQLEELMHEAGSEKERNAFKQFMHQLKSM